MAYYGIQNRNLNSSLSFRQAAFTFRLPRTISCSSWIMILLEDDLPGPLTIEQVSFKSYLPSKKIYLSRTTGQDFIEPHIIIIIVIIISHVKMYVLFYSCFLLCSFFKDVYILTFSLHVLTFTIVSDWRPNIVHFPSYITIPFPRKARLNDDYLTFLRIEFQNSLPPKRCQVWNLENVLH